VARCSEYGTYKVVKFVEFHPEALREIRSFSEEARGHIGKALYDLQLGASLTMPLSRTMASIAVGVHELRVKDAHGAYRVFYVAKLSDRIVVFHAFTKKGRKDPDARD
jgi:phage-related protein